MSAAASRSAITRHGVGEFLSQVVVHGDTAYVAGQMAAEPVGSASEETSTVLRQIDGLLAEVGTDRSRLLSVSIILVDIADFPEMNQAWMRWLDGVAPPARVTTQSALAIPERRIEIAAVAAL